MFVDQIRDKEVAYAPAGGTTMVTAKQVGKAAVKAMEFGEHQGRYPIAATNMTFTECDHYIVETRDAFVNPALTVVLQIKEDDVIGEIKKYLALCV